MKNTIYTDADLNAQLLRCEEYDGNLVEIIIEADNTTNQELSIVAESVSITKTVTPGILNSIEIPREIWNFGGSTTITLNKNGIDAETITLTFPEAIDIDSGAALNETETANEYRMDGSQSISQQISNIQEQVQTVSMQTIDYILPTTINQADIADGSRNTVLTFDVSCSEEDSRTAMLVEIQFMAETTVTGSTFEDLLLTANIELDGNAVGTMLKTYSDGRQNLKIDYLFENLNKGNHTMTVTLEASGGDVSLMQVLSAFLIAAKSTGGGSSTYMTVFSNGKWAPGILADGLDPGKMSKESMLNGIENGITKKAIARTISGATPPISDLEDWFLSEYLLLNGEIFAELFFIDANEKCYTRQGARGSHISTTGQPVGDCNSDMYIPIKRITGYKKLRYQAKIIKNNGIETTTGQDRNNVMMGAAAVVNGVMVKRWGPIETSISNWTTYEVDISDLPYIDYIVVSSANGAPGYKNFILIKD